MLMSDAQKLTDSHYEDISNLLNNGEVPNLYNMEEKSKITEEISAFMPIGTLNQKFAFFIKKCKTFLRIVMCMSPIGESY